MRTADLHCIDSGKAGTGHASAGMLESRMTDFNGVRRYNLFSVESSGDLETMGQC